MKTLQQRAVAVGLAGAMMLGAVAPGLAAPVMTNTAVLKNVHADTSDVVDVRYRGHGYRGYGYRGAGIGLGLAAGALFGAAVASSRNGYYYGDPYYARGYGYNYGYEPPAYYAAEPEPVYEAPPVVYARPAPVYSRGYAAPIDPNGPQRRCWVATDRDRGYGYWGVC
jgi:hypothetical protein